MLGKVIYNLLSNSSEVTDLVSTKIYPNIIQDEKKINYIVYEKNSQFPTNCKDGRSTLDVASFSIFIYSDSLDTLNKISLAVRNTLDRFSGVNSGLVIDNIIYIDEDNDFDETSKIYQIEANYEIRWFNIYSQLAQPTNFTISQSNATTLSLNWTDNATSETGYKIYRSDDGITFSLVATIAANSTSHEDTVSQGVIYYYYVVPYDSNGNGYASKVVAQRTNAS